MIGFMILPNICFIAILCGWWWWQTSRGLTVRDFPSLLGLAPPVLGWLGVAAWRLRDRRLRQRLAHTNGCLCVRCAHSIHGLGGSGACPECGLPFERDRTVKAWIDSRLYKPPSTPAPAAD